MNDSWRDYTLSIVEDRRVVIIPCSVITSIQMTKDRADITFSGGLISTGARAVVEALRRTGLEVPKPPATMGDAW
jgi:hypothetical protein